MEKSGIMRVMKPGRGENGNVPFNRKGHQLTSKKTSRKRGKIKHKGLDHTKNTIRLEEGKLRHEGRSVRSWGAGPR